MIESQSTFLDGVKPLPQNKKQEQAFVSKLGNFHHLQERIILYGRSKKILFLEIVLNLILYSVIVLFLILSANSFIFRNHGSYEDFNYIKYFFILFFLFSYYPILAVSSFRRGCKRVDIKKAIRGISMIRFMYTISYVMLVALVIITSISLGLLLFASFTGVIVSAALATVIFYFYFQFVNKVKSFLDEIMYSLSPDYLPSNAYPSAEPIRPYLSFFLGMNILGIISFIFSNFDVIGEIEMADLEAYEFALVIYIGLMMLEIVSSIIVLSLTSQFNDFISLGKISYAPSNSTKATTTVYPMKRDIETEDWKLKI